MSSSPERIAAGKWEDKSSLWYYLPWSPILEPDNRDFVDDKLFKARNHGRGFRTLSGRSFVGANLEYANLRGIDLRESDFRYAKLKRARFDYAVLKNADLSFSNLYRATLTGAALDDVRLWGANLHRANFSGADLKRGEFHGANLEHALFDGSNMKDTRLVGTNLRHTRLIGANLKRAVFIASYLAQANFSGAELKNATFIGALMSGSELFESIGINACKLPEDDSTNIRICNDDEIASAIDVSKHDFKEIRLIPDERTKATLTLLHLKMPDARQVAFDDLTEEERKKLWGSEFREEHCNFLHKGDFQLDELRYLLHDEGPIFDSSNLQEIMVDEAMYLVLAKSMDSTELEENSQSMSKDFLDRPPPYWSLTKLEKSDAHKLELAGCREQIMKRLPNEASKVGKLNGTVVDQNFQAPDKRYFSNLENIICTAGSYPHVANTIIMSGRLEVNGKEKRVPYSILAQNVIEKRCTAKCPGTIELHPNAINKLWNIAKYDGQTSQKKQYETADISEEEWLNELPYKTDSVPQVVAQCDLWLEFQRKTKVN